MSSNFPATAESPSQPRHSLKRGWTQLKSAVEPRALPAALLVAVAYYAGAKLGFAFTFQPQPISVLWPPNALLMAGLLLVSPRHWWIVLLAVFPAHLAAELQNGVPTSMVLAWFASNCAEALIGAGAIRLLVRGPLDFSSLRHTEIFLVCGAGLAPLLSTFLDVGLVKLIGWGEGDFLQLVRMRFLSNALAVMILVPVIIAWSQGGLRALRDSTLSRRLEVSVLFGGLLSTGLFVFESGTAGFTAEPALLYAPLPFLLWAAVRLGPRSVSLCLLLMFGLAIFGVVHGKGPFVDGTAAQNAVSVQLFVLAVGVPFLLFTAVMAEHRNDRRAVEESEQRALTVFRAGPDAMAIVRIEDGAILDVNDRWTDLFGHAREAAVGRTTSELRMYANSAVREAYMNVAMREGARNFEADMLDRTGGLHHTLLSSERVLVGGTDCLISVIRDMTGQRRSEREAQEQRAELAHLSRVAVLGELSGALAHELNQPLTAILSNAQTAQRLLARETIDIPELREILDDIASEDKRAGEVIRRLRALFKKGETQFQRLDVNDLVNDALKLAYGNLATRHIQTTTSLCAHALHARGDRVQLQQVLLNLIVNACEAMETPGSTRTLAVQTTPMAENALQIIVRDGGPGVPESVMARLFDPFFTTKQQGLGLGLSISRSIITAHGGQLLARNNADGGATFRMILPLHA